MKKLRLLGLFFGLVLISPNLGWSQSCDTAGDEFCCDEDFGAYDAVNCQFAPGGDYPGTDSQNSDIDCGPLTGDCATIPIDGGLSLLALAGGGLATAAMRRRREEEEAAAQGAA